VGRFLKVENSNSPVIGVVTVTYNSAAFLDEFVRCCAMQSLADFKVYCIDNDSRDGTPPALRAISDPRWRITLNQANLGVAEGNNQGIIQALRDGCEWVLLLNNDTSFPAGFFRQLLDACIHSSWRVVVPKIHYDTPAGHIWYAGGGFNPRRGYTGFHTCKGERDNGQRDQLETTEYAPTCAMLVHRSVFEQVGLMDESYFVYFDDTDFCWRLRQAGIPIGYWPNVTLIHKVGGSTGGESSPFFARMTARNRLYYLRKHFGVWQAWGWTPVFLAYYVGRYLLRGWKPACFKASLDGTFSYRSLSPRIPPIVEEPRRP
jgi:GT2 family glycosyltransferase